MDLYFPLPSPIVTVLEKVSVFFLVSLICVGFLRSGILMEDTFVVTKPALSSSSFSSSTSSLP